MESVIALLSMVVCWNWKVIQVYSFMSIGLYWAWYIPIEAVAASLHRRRSTSNERQEEVVQTENVQFKEFIPITAKFDGLRTGQQVRRHHKIVVNIHRSNWSLWR